MSETYFYSASTGGFYPESMLEIYENSINGLPGDLKEVSEANYNALIVGQESGKRIIADKKGNPILSAQAEPSGEEVINSNSRKKTELIASATAKINPLQDAVDMEIATDEENKSLNQWKLYRVSVNRVDTTQKEINWPDIPA